MSPTTPEASSPPIYQTDLAQTPLPEILVKVHHYKVPGRIDCRRGDEFKRIYLEEGEIIFATTSLTTESLGDRLLNAGRLTPAQYEESLRRSREMRKRHGEALVSMGIVTSEELFIAVREQIEAIVWSIFGWASGAATFTPGREKHLEFVKTAISMPKAILRGVRRMPDARSLIARIGTKATLLERGTTPPEPLAEDEQALLDAVDGKQMLFDVVNLPQTNPSENARILYGLFVLGYIRARERGPVKVQLKTNK